ncbi:MAG: hypothetical protein A3B37_00555 [Candidatus Sungbacteria bacterium RIFCSPLOWO2_01_FULL_59_16]|uniref:Uncharacterized protein n=1 Tax=Candidatus Sungbacteria bacterium RIFCSPLOWO2_01_FULL_59_16 TaxID=1802280 RepID=A0A1G2LB23_9BACT|nr:MAG: hypothetical protein A3B37_00555 [Candidatus Sungbacteria bacterium RIFCSPLOWO2_01_FULL_59_16]
MYRGIMYRGIAVSPAVSRAIPRAKRGWNAGGTVMKRNGDETTSRTEQRRLMASPLMHTL